MSSTTVQAAARWMPSRRESRLSRLFDNKAFLVALCLLPSAGLLLVNPPWMLMGELKAILPELEKPLGQGGAGRFRLEVPKP